MRSGPAVQTMAGVRRIHRAKTNLRASPAELERHQTEALNLILDDAMRTEPYRQLYGSRPPLERLEQLRSLPVIDRSYITSFAVEDRLTRRLPGLETQRSTGSTGEAIESLRSPQETRYQGTLVARQFLAQGIRPGIRRLVLDFGMGRADPLIVRGSEGRIPGWAPIEAQAETIRAFRPMALEGPPSCLLELAEFGCRSPVESIMTFGEVLTPADRQEIRHHFGADPLDLYSASEAGHISWECARRSGYHVNADAVLVEVLDDEDRPVPVGESGHIVLTTLWNPTMPLIRYRIGDMGALLPDRCPCDITLPLMSQVEGRDCDRLAAYDGRRVSCQRFSLSPIGPYHSAIRRWRLVQRAVDDILVEVVWKAEPVPDLAWKMKEAYSRELGGAVNVELRSVDRLSGAPGGKYRWVESRVV